MEAKQKEQARQMTELQSRVDHLQQENDRLRACMEGKRIENARWSSHPAPPIKQNKGKEPILPDDSDAATDDELSSGSSPLPDMPPLKNNVEAELRKRPPRRSSWPISGMPRWVWRELSRERWQSEHAPENIPAWQGAQHHHFHSGIPHSELHQPRICLHILLSKGLRTCCRPH